MYRRKLRKSRDYPHQAHALTFSVYRRQQLLLLPGVPEIFLRCLNEARTKLCFDLWAYVVMPEHAHVVVWPRETTYTVASILSAIKRPAAKEIFALHPDLREKCRVQTPSGKDEYRFWQAGGGYDRNLFTQDAAWAEIKDVHANPAKGGLCHDASDWPFSSAGAYAAERKLTPIVVDFCRWGID